MSLILDAQSVGLPAINLTPDRISQSIFNSRDLIQQSNYPTDWIESQWKTGYGPIARRVDDLIPLAKSIICYHELDRKLVKIPWKENENCPKRIGILTEWDSFFLLNSADKRAISIAVEIFRAKNCQIVDVDLRPHIHELMVTCFALVIKWTSLQGDWFSFWSKNSLGPVEIPNQLLSRLIPSKLLNPFSKLSGTNLTRIIDQASQLASQHSTSFLHNRLARHRHAIFQTLKNLDIGVFICPGSLSSPTEHKLANRSLLTVYSWIWSLLRFPCGTVPITRVSIIDENYPFKNQSSVGKDISQLLKKASGLPVSLGVVGLPWNDEAVLRTMKELESGIVMESK
jgi:Asp-tRNA(Asn)/Glu-tRNA(Gln) amidotransferase A subunit family amidase